MYRIKGTERIVSLFVLAVVLLALTYLWIYDGIHYGYEVKLPEVVDYGTLELGDGMTVCQKICSQNRYLAGVELILINLDEDAKGIVCLSVKDETGRLLVSVEKRVAEIMPGEWTPFCFQLGLVPDHVYGVELSASGCTSAPWVLVSSARKGVEDGVLPDGLQVDGQSKEEGTNLLAGYGFSLTASTWEKFVISLSLLLFAFVFLLWNMGTGIKITGTVKRIQNGVVLGTLFLWFWLMVPNIVYRLENVSLDPSWRYFLNIAMPEGIKFGKDVFFTYGPLGYLCYLMKLPDNGIFYWFGISVWIVVIGVQAYLFWQIYRLYRKGEIAFWAILASFFCLVAAYVMPERDNYLLFTLILSVIVCSYGAKYVRAIPNLILVLMFFGKFSTFTSGLAFLLFYVIFELFFQKEKDCLLLCIPGIVAMPCVYLLYCPSFKSLYEYVIGIFRISDGWMQSAQWDQVLTGREIRILAAIMFFYVILVLISLWINYKRSAVILACSASMFFVYKYATTRHGLVPGLWLFSLLFAAVVLSLDWKELGARCRAQSRIARLIGFFWLAAVCGTGILQANAIHSSFGEIQGQFKERRYTWTHLQENSVSEMVKEESRLPQEILEKIGGASVTVYPWRNGYGAVYEELNMVYYPSVQNVNEFIPWLDGKVADWFLSGQAADFIILSDETIDDHIKYLDNPLTWQAIKSRYQVALIQEDICLLERKGLGKLPQLSLLASEEYKLADRIDCPQEAEYAKIYLKLSTAGKWKKLFWHVGVTNMLLEYEDGSTTYGRAIVPNLVSGFELVRIPQNMVELNDVLFGGDRTAITAFSFDGRGVEDMTDTVLVEWYKIAEGG